MDSNKAYCHSCLKEIPPGGLFYVCRTEIISGSDGVLSDTGEDLETIVASVTREVEGKSEQELMDEVYQEIRMILCPECRLKLRDRVLSMKSRIDEKQSRAKLLQFPSDRTKKTES